MNGWLSKITPASLFPVDRRSWKFEKARIELGAVRMLTQQHRNIKFCLSGHSRFSTCTTIGEHRQSHRNKRKHAEVESRCGSNNLACVTQSGYFKATEEMTLGPKKRGSRWFDLRRCSQGYIKVHVQSYCLPLRTIGRCQGIHLTLAVKDTEVGTGK